MGGEEEERIEVGGEAEVEAEVEAEGGTKGGTKAEVENVYIASTTAQGKWLSLAETRGKSLSLSYKP
jgi:hypothetical protein